MNKIFEIRKRLKKITFNVRREHIGAFSAQSAFFLIMSFIPLLILIFNVLNFSKSASMVFADTVKNIFPESAKDIVDVIIKELAQKRSSVISVTTIVAAWSSGKAFYALSEGLQSVLYVPQIRNYIVLRIKSLIYSLSFSIIIAFLILAGMFGDNIHYLAISYYPGLASYTYFISGIRKVFIIFVLFIIMNLIYIFLPDWNAYERKGGCRNKLRYCFESSAIASFIIYLFTSLFSTFFKIYLVYNNFYGSLGVFIGIMLWIYVSMYVLILGFRLSVFLNRKRMQKK